MLDLILHLLLLGVVVFLLAEMLPGIYVKGYGTALIVAIVYSIINMLLGTVLTLITLPLVFLTLGLFKLVINTFLLWITDQLIESFEIKSLGTTFIAAVIITIVDIILDGIF